MPKYKVPQFDSSLFSYATPIQIRFADIDKMGHVNNATILSYFELARTCFFDELIGETNSWYERGLIIAHTSIDYIKPVYLRDEVKAWVRIAKTGSKSFEVAHFLLSYKNGQEHICAAATSIMVCMNYQTQQSIEIPEEWKQKMK
ncbi:MAG: acyl-CoA thioesterase [Bacteroidetes bacterium]|nr:acyl-CoA thioesterase [Bacteroidota bacterium]